jgi:N-acetylglucosaminyldiphosphoundecaprenol N-acetyl-beta-D-mannosaminyltransferase
VKKNGVVYPALALAEMGDPDRSRFLLLHAGKGGERGDIERIIRENHLEENVRLLGGQGPDAIRELYLLADIVLVPSVHSENVEEATSLSALEAMASGRPLIAGAVGGLAEMVVDGVNGLLVPADPKALAAAILRVAAAPELGSRLAAAAREYVVQKHSHLTAAAAYVEVYRRAGAKAEAPARPAALAEAQPETLPVPDWPSISVLGFPLDVVTLEQAAQYLLARAAVPVPVLRTTLAVSFNPEMVMRAQKDPAAAEALSAADLTYPDGVGAAWAAQRQGGRQVTGDPQRVAGIDLAERLLELAATRGLSVYLLGAASGVAEKAGRRLAERFPGLRVVGTHDGYFSADEEEALVAAIRSSGASMLLAALGAPKQEVFLQRHRGALGVSVGMGVGGSFDVWAGKVKRAPAWTQQAKLEWLYRLARDPRRLRRQWVLPQYAFDVVRWSPDDYGPPRRRPSRAPGSDA